MAERAESRVRWFLVFGLFILSAVAYLDRVNISIAGSSIAAEYHLSHIQLGWIFSSFLVGYALFQTPGGWLADRLGPRRVLTAGVLWWGIFTALTALVSTKVAFAVFLFAAVRFLLGAGEAIIYPASNQFISRWIPSAERGIANGLIFAGVGVGAGVTPILITHVMVRYGWRWSFWMSAVIGLIAGTVWYFLARDTPEEHSHVSVPELRHIQAGRTAKSAKDGRIPWSTIFRSKEVLALTLSYFTFGYVAWIFFSWFFIYLAKVRGLDLKVSAFYTTLPFLAMAAGSPLGGAISDKLTKLYGKRAGRCGIAVFGLFLTAVFLTFGSQVQSARLASIVLAGGAGALYLSQSSFWSVTADIAGGSSGSVSGFMNMGNQFGGALTASLTPAIASRFGWTTSFCVAAGLSVLGAAAWLLVDPERALAPATKLSPSPEKT
ncbi:MAG: major facilitator superfamily 1 [Candidatus Acidoferrum typicum]|nr:major facilitator superfamily 1 [Candidatus Acidoferrum typicum]